ncbi:hypothetical protein SAMN05216464_110204 [Mucilaginibacter pineti]|uniref:Uncharacterized protein n=2 Tax=Mucilaginibacter pineti TaxID=1391627 RepID=A0A1G7GLT5_9SPHI|nr:hypothetical protein SAMN05216464_110204 [Mucilaginibacter pineti]
MSKKYILKPGKHQFAPGSPAVHSNDNLSDAEAQWYLEKYPHIASLFTSMPKDERTENTKVKRSKVSKSAVAEVSTNH